MTIVKPYNNYYDAARGVLVAGLACYTRPMNLLIDGHNLIGQTPGLRLDDPDDEAKLVLLLRSYAARRRHSQLVVIFDHGVYGHPQQLNGYGVSCHFARSPQDADTQIINRIQALKNPRSWALVSADRVLIQAARARGVHVIDARAFGIQLGTPRARSASQPPEKREQPLSDPEIQEWLRLFGEESG